MKVDIWQTLVPEILTRFNTKMIHSATGMTPVEAKRPESEAVVKGRLQVKQLRTRRYPEVNEGDTVRIYQKKRQDGQGECKHLEYTKIQSKRGETEHGANILQS